jgi:hypothetical protein
MYGLLISGLKTRDGKKATEYRPVYAPATANCRKRIKYWKLFMEAKPCIKILFNRSRVFPYISRLLFLYRYMYGKNTIELFCLGGKKWVLVIFGMEKMF